MVPAWVVSLCAFGAAWALWLVRPMPRLIRISIMTPIIYVGFMYLAFQFYPFVEITKATMVRIGLLAMFTPIIVNSIIVRIQWRKGRI
jgi:hypothetical protein